jgi:hypothetical protein
MKRFLGVFLLVIWAGCTDDATDPGVREPDLTFLRFENPAAIGVRQASFWAVRGENRRLELEYTTGAEFLEFEVRANSLLRRADGTLFQDGDSVQITITIDTNNRFIFFFEPSGLVFNPIDPAQLEINYQYADDDIDNDGDRDSNDLDLEAALRIWQQEQPGLPWLPMSTVRIDENDLRANVLSFTGFAMASN